MSSPTPVPLSSQRHSTHSFFLSVYLPGPEAASHLPLSVVLNLAVVLALCVLCSLGEPFNLSKQVCCERRKTPLSLDCCDNQVQRKHLLDWCVFGHPLLPFFGTLFSFLFILRHNHNTDFRGQTLIHGGLSELRKKADSKRLSLVILAMAGNRKLQKYSKSSRANSRLRKCDFALCFSHTAGDGSVVPSSGGQRVRLLTTHCCSLKSFC